MPLVRFELKNEYGLGDSRLYKGARKEEDPRNILSGFTVSGLVGILRQLGDLAEFAAVVFHDVHIQVSNVADRGQKVLNRIQKIEVALPQFEKAVQEQKSHIHFAYVAGCGWHANIQTSQSKLLASDLPEFMMDSYEGCHDPPHLHLLDKFDSGGVGACLKRYSDPSYLRRVIAISESEMVEGAHNGINVQKKKKRSSGREGLARPSVCMTLHGRSLNSNEQFAPVLTDELRFSVDDASISDTLSVSGSRNELMYFSSDKRSGCLEAQNTPSSMSKELYDDDMPAIEAESKQNADCIFSNYSKVSVSDYVIQDLMHLQNSVLSTSISSDEKTEMVMSENQMLSRDIPEDALRNPKAAEFSSAISSKDHGTDSLRIQMELVLRSLICDETATEKCGTSVSSTYSATCDEKNGIMESTSLKFPDDVSPPRSPDFATGQISVLTSQLDKDMDQIHALGSKVQTNFDYETGQGVIVLPHLNYGMTSCEDNMSLEDGTLPILTLDGVVGDISPFGSQDSDFLFLTLETSNQHSGMTGTEMLNQENDLPNTVIESELNMDATNALDSKIKTKFEYQMGREVILLPHLNYYGMECKVNKIVGVASPSIDYVVGDDFPFKPQGLDLLLLTPSNQHYKMTGTEMPNQENYLLNTMKIVPSSAGEIRLLTSQSDKHMNAINAFDSEVPTNIEHQSVGVILLPNQNYDGVGCDINEILGIATTSIDGVDGEIAYESCTSLKEKLSPPVFDHEQPACSAEFVHRLHYSNENAVSKSLSSGSTAENDSEGINNIIPSSQAVIIDAIPPKQSSCQDYFSDSSAKTASLKEVLCERQTKCEVDSASDSNCRLTEYQSSMEKVIVASKLIRSDIETHVACCSSSDDYVSPILFDMITSNTAGSISSSTLTSDFTSSRCRNPVFSQENVSEDPDGSMCSQLPNTSAILPSNATSATTAAFQGFPVDPLRKSSINIWTNGGLLGLEPLKPPVVCVPNTYCSDKINGDKTSADSQPCDLDNHSESRTSSFEADKSNHVVPFPEKDDVTGKTYLKQSDPMLAKQHSERILSKADVHSKYEPESNLSKLNNIGVSVGFSSPEHRFSVDNLQRKSSITGSSPFCELMNKNVHKLYGPSILDKHKERPELAIPSTPIHKLENQDVAHGFSEKFVSSSLDLSGCQSPPLEHMKVAFQPKNNSVASNLRLEFCNIHLEGNMGHATFPSFHLLNESFLPLMDGFLEPDGILESDDDTFCRSCPYSSDDLLALYSESDAETWGEDELDV